MGILSSKWVLIGIAIIAVLMVLYLLGRKSVSTEVVIQATPNEVWSVLTDVAKVREWNQILIPLEGTLAKGNTLKYEFHQEEGGKPAVMEALVKAIEPEQLLNQQGGMQFLLTFDHKYILEPTDNGTRVRIEEYYRGIMVPFWNPQPVESAYHRLLLALKDRVENS